MTHLQASEQVYNRSTTQEIFLTKHMKVLVSCSDGSLKEYLFTKDTDTSDPSCPPPQVQTFLVEKNNPIVRFVSTGDGFVFARKRGHIALYSLEYEHKQDIATCSDLVCLDYFEKSLYYVNTSGEGTIYDFASKSKTTFSLPSGLSVALKHKTDPVMLYSGPSLRPELYSFEEKAVIFQARNPKAKLDLEEKNLVTNAVFLPAETGYAFATITSHGKVRTYETALAKKPTSQTEISKHALKAIAYSEDDTKLVIGDAQSRVGLYDVKPVTLLGYYKGIVGGTSHLSIRKDLLCAVGLDRYIRGYEVSTREPAGKVYVAEELQWAEILQDDEEKREIEEDEFWRDVDNVSKKPKVEKKADPLLDNEEEEEEEEETEASEEEESESEAESEDFEESDSE